MSEHLKALREALDRSKGDLVVISGPSAAAGKGKVIGLLLPHDERYWLSVSMTTRPRRSDDHHGYDYVTAEQFEKLEGEGGFLEANGQTEGNRYGTPLQPILDKLAQDCVVILEIDINGARALRGLYPVGLRAFIVPTAGSLEANLAELRRRLQGRGTNDAVSSERRLKQAERELIEAREPGLYNQWVVNAPGHAEGAAQKLHDLIKTYAKDKTVS